MAYYLPRVTLDIIGLTGFNYSFNALNNESNEFSEAFSTLIHFCSELRSSPDLIFSLLVRYLFPPLRNFHLDERSKAMADAFTTIEQVSAKVVEAEKRRINLDEKNTLNVDDEGKSGDGRNLLSLIMQANSKTLRNGDRGLSDKELAHQIANFLFAGKSDLTLYPVLHGSLLSF